MYHPKYNRFNGLSFDEAYDKWLETRREITDPDERNWWKSIFYFKHYGASKQTINKLIGEKE